MKQIPIRSTSSVAWFKLAEVITRGEKERALSIYRLLMHSVQSEALKAQLEGDILLMFNDANAFNAYLRAATLHQKNNDTFQAFSMYEQILQSAVASGQVAYAYACIGTLSVDALASARLYDQLAITLLLSENHEYREVTKASIAAAIAGYMGVEQAADGRYMSRFLTKLAGIDGAMHSYACECMRAT